ncbi:hypothetical protein KKG82_06290 [Patescibacteria group bacterium]|nr:hypothetical protein [bacterium]MBU1901942.1 hypothetical protein [Patescibacteria group bacterium]
MNSPLAKWLGTLLEWLFRIALAAVFLMAAVPKLLDPATFAKDIVNYRVTLPLIGQGYVFLAAMFMPAFELVGALALLAPRWKRAGSMIIGGLLIVFTILIAQAVIRGLNIDCGCFGRVGVSLALAQKVGLFKIIENIGWIAMAAFVFFRSAPPRAQREHALREGD